ncbi:AzlC family ABC transporter permease [Cucumibacter marinus]|uniref:AzlC family ABC transporter permease n=1 Tax=Cucumibacter marinus TaxID=1121252 RepID=UPI00041A7275|nr:AzlC family ABC transporter permease [Cucumibacter marinus]
MSHPLTLSGALAGARSLAAVAALVIPFGAAFGITAVKLGIDPAATVLMSTLVFAGASQFVALGFWPAPVALAPLLLAVFAVNARHLLLGATLYPALSRLPLGLRHVVAAVISDINWAMAMTARRSPDMGLGVLFGGGLAIWICWIIGTAIGAYAGQGIDDPARFGLNMLMIGFLSCAVVSMGVTRRGVVPWLVAAAVAILATHVLPENWHVLAGGLAGGLTGAIMKPSKRDDEDTPSPAAGEGGL